MCILKSNRSRESLPKCDSGTLSFVLVPLSWPSPSSSSSSSATTTAANEEAKHGWISPGRRTKREGTPVREVLLHSRACSSHLAPQPMFTVMSSCQCTSSRLLFVQIEPLLHDDCSWPRHSPPTSRPKAEVSRTRCARSPRVLDGNSRTTIYPGLGSRNIVLWEFLGMKSQE